MFGTIPFSSPYPAPSASLLRCRHVMSKLTSSNGQVDTVAHVRIAPTDAKPATLSLWGESEYQERAKTWTVG